MEKEKRDLLETLINDLSEDLSEDLRPIVIQTESDLYPTTQAHYGDYLSLISLLSKGNEAHAKLIANALLRAGADSFGVSSALSILYPE